MTGATRSSKSASESGKHLCESVEAIIEVFEAFMEIPIRVYMSWLGINYEQPSIEIIESISTERVQDVPTEMSEGIPAEIEIEVSGIEVSTSEIEEEVSTDIEAGVSSKMGKGPNAKVITTETREKVSKEMERDSGEMKNQEAGIEETEEQVSTENEENVFSGTEHRNLEEPEMNVSSQNVREGPMTSEEMSYEETITKIEELAANVKTSNRVTFIFRAGGTGISLAAGVTTVIVFATIGGTGLILVAAVGIIGTATSAISSYMNSKCKERLLGEIEQLTENDRRRDPNIQKKFEKVREEIKKQEYWLYTTKKALWDNSHNCRTFWGWLKKIHQNPATFWKDVRSFFEAVGNVGGAFKKMLQWVKNIFKSPDPNTSFFEKFRKFTDPIIALSFAPKSAKYSMWIIDIIDTYFILKTLGKAASVADDALVAPRVAVINAKHLTNLTRFCTFLGIGLDAYSLAKDTYDLVKNKEGEAISELIEAMKNSDHVEVEI